MAEEETLKLFAMTLTAWRIEDEQPLVAMRTLVVLLAGEVDLEEEGKKEARKLFPSADGWRDAVAIWTEIPQGLIVGPLRLTWQAEPVAPHDEGAEP